jgi:putative PIN family toxin of toxin-antitoxin system
MADPPLVFVDTNIWISAFINADGLPAKILDAMRGKRVVPVLSPPLVAEIRSVTGRERVRRRILLSDADLEIALRSAIGSAIIVNPTGTLQLCRDPRDDILLETAILARAQFFVSRDDDIKRDLDLISHLEANGVEVVSVAQFLERLEA